MVLLDDQPPGFLEEIKFVSNQPDHCQEAPPASQPTPKARDAWIGQTKPGENQRNADSREDDDLMDEFERHGIQRLELSLGLSWNLSGNVIGLPIQPGLTVESHKERKIMPVKKMAVKNSVRKTNEKSLNK
jgi:hypothetical protein